MLSFSACVIVLLDPARQQVGMRVGGFCRTAIWHALRTSYALAQDCTCIVMFNDLPALNQVPRKQGGCRVKNLRGI